MDATISPDNPILDPDAPADQPAPDEDVGAKLERMTLRWQKVTALENQCRDCALEMQAAAAAHKEAKQAYESAVSKLRGAIRDANSGQQALPFPTDEPSAAPVEDWRATTLADLEITGKLAESLVEAGLTTLGAIADYTAADKRLTDIDGVGPAKAEKIEAACEDWFKRHPGARDGEAEVDDGAAGDGDEGHPDEAAEGAEQS